MIIVKEVVIVFAAIIIVCLIGFFLTVCYCPNHVPKLPAMDLINLAKKTPIESGTVKTHSFERRQVPGKLPESRFTKYDSGKIPETTLVRMNSDRV